jgi:transcriptional regulator with XRE-family HTH domain
MIIGERLRFLRESKGLTQGDIEKRTGLLRCYISRVENGQTVPALETLEKLARALEMPLYEFLYDGDEPPKPLPAKGASSAEDGWGYSGKDVFLLQRLRRYLANMKEEDRKLLLFAAQKMVRNRKGLNSDQLCD